MNGIGENRYFPNVLLLALLLTGSAVLFYGNARLLADLLIYLVLCGSFIVFRSRCRLGERISAGSIALIGYTILYTFSCLLGPYGCQSLPNAASLLIGTAVYLLFLSFSGELKGSGLIEIFCTGISFIALLSLDASSAQLLVPRILVPVLARFGGPSLNEMQYEEGMRIIGVIGGANVLAGLLGIGTLLSLYLFLNSQGRRRIVFAMMLSLNATVFFLAFSMGAFCAFALAAAVYLFLSPYEKRGRVFLCMVITAVISILCVLLMSRGLGKYQSAASFFSLICPLAFGVVLAYVFPYASKILERLSESAYRKGLTVLVIGALFIVALYSVLAIIISTPVALTPWGAERVAYLQPGDYTIDLTSDSPVELLIASQNRDEVLDGYYNYLYKGNTQQAEFTVPEGAGIVRFSFTGSGKLYRAVYHGSGEGELRMNSPLVPEFVTNRMRGVFFSKNILERFGMFRDGLKLFSSSPVFGPGAGAFEAKAYRVQQHYYETKYIHNQYIQSLVDTGAVGLVLFLLILIAAFRQILRHRSENPALAATMLACLTMATIHGFTEVVWSMHAYLLFLMLLLAICELAFPSPIKSITLRKWIPRSYMAVTLGFVVAIIIHLFVQMGYRNPPESGFTPERIAYLCKMEPFCKEIYQLDYVCNYGADAAESDEYLASLRSRESYDINMLLLQYVYLPSWDLENIRSATREAYLDRRHDEEALNTLYQLLTAYHADKLFMEENN